MQPDLSSSRRSPDAVLATLAGQAAARRDSHRGDGLGRGAVHLTRKTDRVETRAHSQRSWLGIPAPGSRPAPPTPQLKFGTVGQTRKDVFEPQISRAPSGQGWAAPSAILKRRAIVAPSFSGRRQGSSVMAILATAKTGPLPRNKNS